MTEPTILALKPRQVTAEDKKILRAAGVIVIEVANPEDVRFLRPSAELSTTEMLCAALTAIKRYGGSQYLGEEIIEAVLAKQPGTAP